MTETKEYQLRLGNSWVIINSINPVMPKAWNFIINIVPMVTHHSKNIGLRALVRIPRVNAL